MRIALIEPPYRFREDNLNQGMFNLPGMAYVSTILKQQGHDVKIVDLKNDRDASLDDALTSDVVGIASYINGHSFLEQALPALKRAGKTIITGGPFVSSYGACPDNLLMNVFPQIDFAVIGEGEITTPELIRSLEDASRPIPAGVIYRKNGMTLSTGAGKMLLDIDDVPDVDFADWKALAVNAKGNVLNTGFSRGCYNRCSFCYQISPGIRSFSFPRIDRKLEEIAKLGPRQIMLEDTTFSYDRARAIKIAKLADRHNLRFGIETRVTDVDYDLMKELKENGCNHVLLGIESFDDDILRNVSKNITTGDVYKAIDDCRRAGLETAGFFLVGLPGENKNSLKKTIQGIRETRILPAPRILIPLPGTQIYRDALKRGLIDEIEFLKRLSDPDKFDTTQGSWVPVNMSDGLTDQELLDARDEMNRLREEFSRG